MQSASQTAAPKKEEQKDAPKELLVLDTKGPFAIFPILHHLREKCKSKVEKFSK